MKDIICRLFVGKSVDMGNCRGMVMGSEVESRRKKIVLITYCMLCLTVSISLLTRDVIVCYNKYLSGEYQLRAEAKIVNTGDIDFINYVPGQDYLCHVPVPDGVGTEVYMYNIHNNKCDIYYDQSYYYLRAKDVSLNDLSYNSNDYKLLTGEKQYNLFEYMQRVLGYTPLQLKNGFTSGTLEDKIYQQIRVFSVLLVFDFIYVIYKFISKKKNYVSRILNGIMYVSSTFCLLISVFGMYLV